MTFDAQRHHRRSIRLHGYDYARGGAYFVTLCTRDRELLFEKQAIRAIAEQCWLAIPEHVPTVELDEWVVMPNHIHGIIVIGNNDIDDERDASDDSHRRGVQLNAPTVEFNDARGNRSPNSRYSAISPHRNTLGVIVRTYKAAVTMLCRREGYGEFGWQRNYYEHIVRSEDDLHRIRQYIMNNPLNWDNDSLNAR